jgi:hypothetical protein
MNVSDAIAASNGMSLTASSPGTAGRAGRVFTEEGPVYAIDEFPDDELPWRIEWIGGVGYNTSVPSDPRIDVCLAQLPLGEMNPLSARSWARITRANHSQPKTSANPCN